MSSHLSVESKARYNNNIPVVSILEIGNNGKPGFNYEFTLLKMPLLLWLYWMNISNIYYPYNTKISVAPFL